MEDESKIIVLHLSNNYLVINKPYDMAVNSNDPTKVTLQTEIRKLFPNLVNPNLVHEFHFVHRLDYATSGAICVALNRESARAASTSFEKRRAKKYYLALVHGHIEQPSLIIEKAIGSLSEEPHFRDSYRRPRIKRAFFQCFCKPCFLSLGHDVREVLGNRKMCTNDNVHCAKPRDCLTALLVLEKGLRNGNPATKVLLRLGTGRRHQLRVHCFHIGHTIIGDYTYSDGEDHEPHRTFLHSFRLVLENEIENLEIQTADPFDSSDSRNQWVPTEVLWNLNEETFSAIDKLLP